MCAIMIIDSFIDCHAKLQITEDGGVTKKILVESSEWKTPNAGRYTSQHKVKWRFKVAANYCIAAWISKHGAF